MGRSAWLPIGGGAAAGALMALAFPLGPPWPPVPWDGLPAAGWLCLAPLIWAAVTARGAPGSLAAGLTAGLIGFGSILSWLHPFLVRWALLSGLEALGVTILLVLYLSVYPVLFCLLLGRIRRRRGVPAALAAAPAVWVGLELARARLFTGFPWCLLGYSQPASSWIAQAADLGGVYAVSFLLACAGSGAALIAAGRAARARGEGPSRRLAALLIGLPAAGLAYGTLRPGPAAAAPGEISVALVQANVPQAEKWEPEQRDRIEQDHMRLTREAAAQGASFVIWSESAVPISLTHHPEFAARLADLADRTGAELLLGTVVYETRDGQLAPLNSATLVRPAMGITGRYDKRHLVPFGEYVPLKPLLSFLQPLVEQASDFAPGVSRPLPESRAGRLGVLICYEAIFPELAARQARDGARLLVNLTNDAWYGQTAMPRQHLAMSAMRAVEIRRWLLRCANTGISAVVDPSGRIVERAELGSQRILLARAAPLSGSTLYAASRDGFAIACAILTLALAVMPRRGAPGGLQDAR